MTANKLMNPGNALTLLDTLARSLSTNEHPGCGMTTEEEAMFFAAVAGTDIPPFVIRHAVLSRAGWLRLAHALSFYRHHKHVVLDNPEYEIQEAIDATSLKSWAAVQSYLEGFEESWASSRFPAIVAEIDEIGRVLPRGGAA